MTAEQIFEKHWVKSTGKSLDETTKNHMQYAIDAINEALKKDTDNIKKALSAINQTYSDLVEGEVYPIDEFSSVALNLKYAIKKLTEQ